MTMAVPLSFPGFSKIFEEFQWFPMVFLPRQRNPVKSAPADQGAGRRDAAEFASVGKGPEWPLCLVSDGGHG
jgi:hypothetical protein